MIVIDDLNQKVLAAFQIEHREHLESIRRLLADAELAGAPVDPPRLDEALRLAHSLKGGARVCDLRHVEALGHRLETLYARVRQGEMFLDADVVQVSRLALDAIEDLMAAVSACDPLMNRRRPSRPSIVCSRPKIRRKPVVTPNPSSQSPLPNRSHHNPQRQLDMVRISVDSLDRLLRHTVQFHGESLRQSQMASDIGRLQQQLDDLELRYATVRRSLAGRGHLFGATANGDGPAACFLNLENEVRGISRSARLLQSAQQHSAWSLGSLVEQVQQDVRRARLVPAEEVFQGFRKMVRDLAVEQGKQIDFRVTGLDVQADRMVLQAVKDALMHTLRNAVVHGVESPTERRARGKSETGYVQLRLEVAGHRLQIIVDDDGRGLDLEMIGEIAVRRGLVSQEEAAGRPADLARMIFQPGFTTSEIVNELAGRGMGLSVVLECVQRLQGDVQLRAKPTAGTTMVISVPLSICTHRVLLVSCAGQTIGVPVAAIDQLLRCPLSEINSALGRPMVSYQSDLVPLVSLAQLLGTGPTELNVDAGIVHVAIFNCAGQRVAVSVDAFVAERDCLLEKIQGLEKYSSRFSAAMMLEDGNVGLVLNTASLMMQFDSAQGPPRCTLAPAAPAASEFTILVVDDSFTARTLEKSLLEANGFRVEVAVDGSEALALLRASKVDLVISDIEMPKLDGFELLEAMKKDAKLKDLPVILVTSLDRQEDQERGLTLGADAYVVKRKFDHQELLKTITHLL